MKVVWASSSSQPQDGRGTCAFFFLFGMKKFSFSKEYKLFNLKRNKSSQVAKEEVSESTKVQKIIKKELFLV